MIHVRQDLKMLKLFWLAATLNAQILGYNFFSPHDPALNWQTLETQNFEIIYNYNQKDLAIKVAHDAERSHQILASLLKINMNQKTVIVISDHTDSSNGMATGFPRPTIEVYPALPHPADSIGEYSDWTEELIIHEYAHILNFEPYGGVVGFIRTLLGSIWKPPMFLPRWYTEGFAVEMESRYTNGGRGKSLLYQAQARAFFEDQKWGLETIDRINSTSIPTWPRGARPYYFGWLIHYELGKLKGSPIYEEFNTRYGQRVPWFINGPIEDATGLSYEEFLLTTYDKYNLAIKSQLETLKKSGVVNGVLLKQAGYLNRSSQISPDQLKLAAISSQFNKEQSIVVWKRTDKNNSFTLSQAPETITTGKEMHQISWLSDSETILFDQQDTLKHYYSYNDLYLVNIKTKKQEQLTYGQRARDAVALTDTKYVFVQLHGASSLLCLFDKEKNKVEVIKSFPLGYRISNLIKSGAGLIYTVKNNLGEEKEEFYNLSSPTAYLKTKKGQIYLAQNKTENLVATNTTLAIDPVWDQTTNEIIYSRLTSEGYLLEAQKLEKKNYPLLEPVFKYENFNLETQPPQINKNGNYSSLSYLFPQYWFPFVFFVPGGAVYSISTSANDPLYFNQYSIEVGYDTRAQKVKQSVQYTNSSLPFVTDVYFANDYQYLAGANAVERIVYGALTTSHFLQEHKNQWQLQPQLIYKMTDYPGFLFTEAGPGLFLNFSNLDSKKDYQISIESGHSFSVGYNYFLPNLGNISYQGITLLAQSYLSGWILPDRNVVKLRLASWISPPQNTILTGYQQAGGEYGSPFYLQNFLVRGYPYGEFIGNNLYNLSFEYRFPLGYPFGGPGTAPLFIQSSHVAITADALSLDGGYYDLNTSTLRSVKVGKIFSSAGIEVKADTQIFYFIPMTFKLGYYYAFNLEAYGGHSVFLGIGSSL